MKGGGSTPNLTVCLYGPVVSGGPLILKLSNTVFFRYYLKYTNFLIQLGFCCDVYGYISTRVGEKEAQQLMRFS